MKPLILISLLLTAITACALGKFVRTGPTYSSYEGPVKVLFEPPKGVKYEEIGLVSSYGGMIHQWTDLIEAMQKEAAKYGANAIIIGSSSETKNSMVTYNSQFGLQGGTYPRKDVIGVAIRVIE